MPILPSGRRIELSTDRFRVYLSKIDATAALELLHSLKDPDDLLFVADVVFYAAEPNATAMLAGFVASDWEANSLDWTENDRASFKHWLASEAARRGRADEISSIKESMEQREPSIAPPL